MIEDDRQLEVTQQRILHFERQVSQIRRTEANADNYRASAGGLLAEIDRMNLEIRDYLWSHPAEHSVAPV